MYNRDMARNHNNNNYCINIQHTFKEGNNMEINLDKVTIEVTGQEDRINRADYVEKWVAHAKEMINLAWADDGDKFHQILELTEALANARFEQLVEKQVDEFMQG